MAAARARTLLHSWETVRFELLNTRVCDLNLRIEESPLEPFTRRLHNELDRQGLTFEPEFYLTDGWGCPDEVPVIGIPFYLADRRLARIEEEQTGEIEDEQMLMMLLRHEAGHAINYAYKLYEHSEWVEVFGPFSRPYRDTFRTKPFSKHFVRHLSHSAGTGRTYAQKHPDEDFAETFAVWLTPRSSWRRRYRYWPAIRKLKYVDALMKSIAGKSPKLTYGNLSVPVERMEMLLAEHYGQRAERYREAAQGYVDDKLHEVFPEVRGRVILPVNALLEKHHDDLLARVTRWSALEEAEVETILSKLKDRAEALNLTYNVRHAHTKLLDVTALATSLALDFAYTGRLTG